MKRTGFRKGTARAVAAGVLAFVGAGVGVGTEIGVAFGGELGGTRVDLTATTGAAWHADNGNGSPCDDRYGDGVLRLNAVGNRGPWRFGVRLDGAAFVAAPGAGDGCSESVLENRYQPRGVPEKLQLGWAGRDVTGRRDAEVTLGDAYVSFGRGLTLSLRKVDELGVDTTLRGAKVILRNGALSATVAAGTPNPGNLDEASGRRLVDPYDLVAGVESRVALGRRAGIGAHVAAIAFHEPHGFVPPGQDLSYGERWLIGGPVFDAPRLSKQVGVYLEGVAQRRAPAREGSEVETGFGLYGAVTILAGRATVLVEGKAYGDLEIAQPDLTDLHELEFSALQYAAAPTAERLLQEIAHPQREIFGARVRVDVAASTRLAAHASAAVFRDQVGYDVDVDPGLAVMLESATGTIVDPYAGVELRWDSARSRALLSGGYRAVVAGEQTDLVYGDGHVELDFVQAFAEGRAVEVGATHLERQKIDAGVAKDWREGSVQLGTRPTRRLLVAAGWDYTTDTSQPRTHFLSGTLEWQLSASSSVRLFGGAMRGGLKCVSGVCRTFPPFEGVKLAMTLRW
ncbi:MAG: hypothetical protein EXR73_15105 [Myxococcales bacterium]|nr:hypothetical protein [Myxococcales bacterium]